MTTFTAYGGTGVNCLQACLATFLQAGSVEEIPRPEDHFEPGRPDNRGFDLCAYNDALEERTGHGLRTLSWSECPPGDRYWIAIMRTSRSEHETHAIACRGRQLFHDPSDVFKAYQPSMLEYGLMLVEA
jgi:hypothetical protein